jgi:arylsulfate sulfotransferase
MAYFLIYECFVSIAYLFFVTLYCHPLCIEMIQNIFQRRNRMNAMKASVGIALTALLVCSVTQKNARAAELQFVDGPTISANPNTSTPLVAILEFSTNVPAKATVEVTDGDRTFSVPTQINASTDHRITILNLRPDTTHQIHLSVSKDTGQPHEPISAELIYETGPLPEYFPDIVANIPYPNSMEPGVTLFSLIRWMPIPDFSSNPVEQWFSVPAQAGLLIIVDNEGKIVWYHEADESIVDAKRLQNGNLSYIKGEFGVVEIDMEGTVVNHYFAAARNSNVPAGAIAMPVDTFHHEVFEMPNKHRLGISTELRMLSNYPTSEEDPDASPSPAPVPVVGDVIVEFNTNGNILSTWNLMDILDPYIIGYGSLTETYWRRAPYDGYVQYDPNGLAIDGPKDWSHSNGVIYDPSDDSIIVSSRHLDAVTKFSRATGELIWILGDHGGWTAPFQPYLLTPQGELDWQYHQHAPMITTAGEILLYDNDNFRAKPFVDYFDPFGNPLPNPTPASNTFSRAVIFDIDEIAMTVSQPWESLGQYYAPFICDADEMPQTGNILIDHGGQIQQKSYDGFQFLLLNKRAHIKEVTRSTNETVFELFIDVPDPWTADWTENRSDWSSYRAERLPSIYP